MKQFFCYFLFASLFVTSCENKDVEQVSSSDCKSENAVEQLAWVKEKIDDLRKQSTQFWCTDKEVGCFYIARGEINGETVFEVGNCCPNMNSIPTFFKCDGTSFCNAEDYSCMAKTVVDNRKLLWSSNAK